MADQERDRNLKARMLLIVNAKANINRIWLAYISFYNFSNVIEYLMTSPIQMKVVHPQICPENDHKP